MNDACSCVQVIDDRIQYLADFQEHNEMDIDWFISCKIVSHVSIFNSARSFSARFFKNNDAELREHFSPGSQSSNIYWNSISKKNLTFKSQNNPAALFENFIGLWFDYS